MLTIIGVLASDGWVVGLSGRLNDGVVRPMLTLDSPLPSMVYSTCVLDSLRPRCVPVYFLDSLCPPWCTRVLDCLCPSLSEWSEWSECNYLLVPVHCSLPCEYKEEDSMNRELDEQRTR